LFHCTPHPGLGTVLVRHVQIDLATCLTAKAPPLPESVATVRVTKDSQSIVFKGRVVLTIHENHQGFPAGSPGPIELEGVSPNGKWILYAIDPTGSASLAADGLTLKAVRSTGGRSYTVASGLLYGDYRVWCDGKLVMTAGGDRYAADHKSLIITEPPAWKARRMVIAPAYAFGSLTCDHHGVDVQVTRDRLTTSPNWAIWTFGLDSGTYVIDTPPKGWSDDSPQASADGTIYFVRSRKGLGLLYAVHRRKLVGPLLSLGHEDGYYGHRVWPYTVTR
jgi:hypothetical protein